MAARWQSAGGKGAGDRRAVVSVEFAILAIPYFLLVLAICEISFDLFMQEATDLALQSAARSIETGAAASATSESDFVTNFVCNTTGGRMLVCSHFHIKLQVITLTNAPNQLSSVDFSSYPPSNGTLPMSGSNLDLSTYDGTTSYCSAPPGTLIMISAIYVGPTFLFGMLPSKYNEYLNGVPVHAVLSQVGLASENFPYSSGGASTCS